MLGLVTCFKVTCVPEPQTAKESFAFKHCMTASYTFIKKIIHNMPYATDVYLREMINLFFSNFAFE